MRGDRKWGGRAREKERESEGDRRRKSLRHGWMRLLQMAAWAEKPWNLKQQLQSFSSWGSEAKRWWIAHSLHSGISSRKHLLSTSFCWFRNSFPCSLQSGLWYTSTVGLSVFKHKYLLHYPTTNGKTGDLLLGYQFFTIKSQKNMTSMKEHRTWDSRDQVEWE